MSETEPAEFDEERLKAFNEAIGHAHTQAVVADALNHPEELVKFRARVEREADGLFHVYSGDEELGEGWSQAEYREVMRRQGFARGKESDEGLPAEDPEQMTRYLANLLKLTEELLEGLPPEKKEQVAAEFKKGGKLRWARDDPGRIRAMVNDLEIGWFPLISVTRPPDVGAN
jgi:hypothetical protein